MTFQAASLCFFLVLPSLLGLYAAATVYCSLCHSIYLDLVFSLLLFNQTTITMTIKPLEFLFGGKCAHIYLITFVRCAKEINGENVILSTNSTGMIGNYV